MTRCVKVPLVNAEVVKKDLAQSKSFDENYYPKKEDGFLYFPVKENYTTDDFAIVEFDLNCRTKNIPISFKEALSKILNEEEMNEAKTAYDMAGSIAIIEVPDCLNSKTKEMGEALLATNPNIKTVLKKAGIHDGVFRTQATEFVAGIDTHIAEYRENNCILKFDVSEVYFSVRLSTERKRIAALIGEGEDVLVMFSGAAPYPCVLSKNTEAKHITGVEINPKGYEFGLENVKKNKLTNVELHLGDVREVVPRFNKTFDRIVMPLPKTAEQFLDTALTVARKGTMIHLYGFHLEDDFEAAKAEAIEYCTKAGRKCKIINFALCGQHAPRSYRICMDILVEN